MGGLRSLACWLQTLFEARMKILLYGLNYSPEVIGIGKYTGELARYLAAQGHDVRVVTAPPYYPSWQVAPGFFATRYATEQQDGVAVWRCPLWLPRRVTGATRIVHHLSFAISSLPVMLRQLFWRPDAVWVVAPSLMCTPTAWLVARLARAKAWLHVQDFELDAAFSLGILKNPVLKALALRLERFVLRRFDVVSTISQNMRSLLHSKGVPSAATEMLPNWVDISHIGLPRSHDSVAQLRQTLGIEPSALVCLYSGNMGAKQGLEILAEVARHCSQSAEPVAQHLVFVFCGNGAGRDALAQGCQGLSQVRFLDLQPLQLLPSLLALADIHLLPQRADAADLVMPSKLTGMLASGRPVVATAHLGTELAAVVGGELSAGTNGTPANPLGYVVPPEDAAAMAQAVLQLAANPGRRHAMGQAARAFAEIHLDQAAVLARFATQLKAVVQGRSMLAQSLVPEDRALRDERG